MDKAPKNNIARMVKQNGHNNEDNNLECYRHGLTAEHPCLCKSHIEMTEAAKGLKKGKERISSNNKNHTTINKRRLLGFNLIFFPLAMLY